jgi:S-formylglutathione hydrolase FrmB
MKFFKCFFLFILLGPAISSFAASVDTLDIASKVMQKNIRAAVVIPDSYKRTKKLNYPVLYLLHGGTGSYRDWLTKTPDKQLLHRLADQYNLIIVTPDSPLDKNSQYETFISKELIEKIDDAYRTIKDRNGRVIAGLSMGGHGAMYLSTRRPDLYCAAGSMSGVMNINTATWKVPADFAKLRADNFARLLGVPKDTTNPYLAYTAVGRVNEFKSGGLKLIFDCGVDDFLIDTNRDLHQRLLAGQVPHDYIERPGAHTWEYWENALPYQVLFFHKVLQANGVSIP